MGQEPVESATGHAAANAPLRPESARVAGGRRGLSRVAKPAWRSQPLEPELADPEADPPSPFDTGTEGVLSLIHI